MGWPKLTLDRPVSDNARNRQDSAGVAPFGGNVAEARGGTFDRGAGDREGGSEDRVDGGRRRFFRKADGDPVPAGPKAGQCFVRDSAAGRQRALRKNMFAPVVCILLMMQAAPAAGEPATGPLRVHPRNPRYFTDGSGRAIYLTGSHTWSNLTDLGPTDPPAAFHYTAYLRWMRRYRHNFIRLWSWELVNWDTSANGPGHGASQVHTAAPHPWARTGPGEALDKKLKFWSAGSLCAEGRGHRQRSRQCPVRDRE